MVSKRVTINQNKDNHLTGRAGEIVVKKFLSLNGYRTYKPLDFFNSYYNSKYIHVKNDLGVDYIAVNDDSRTVILVQAKNSKKNKRVLSKKEINKFLSTGKYYEDILKNDYKVYYALFVKGDISNRVKDYIIDNGIDNFVVMNMNSLNMQNTESDVKLLDKETGRFVNCDLFKSVSVLQKNGIGLEKTYELKNLMHHQRDAIDFIFRNMKAGYNRFTLAMATGTGKTLTYIRLMIEMVKSKGYENFIIFSPSVSLIAQILKSVVNELKVHGMYQDFDILCVTHDKTVSDDPLD
ncbi:MAG: DEAD/DEAH box helicase family protein, partial [Candidatus Aenigmatarchaeota archaeon]